MPGMYSAEPDGKEERHTEFSSACLSSCATSNAAYHPGMSSIQVFGIIVYRAMAEVALATEHES